MKKNLSFILLLALSITSHAQDYAGYSSGNYTGVNSVFFNPGNAADSRYKWSFNLASISTTISNNYATVKTSDLFKSIGNDSLSNFLTRNDSGYSNLLLNVDIFGPSILFNINAKSSFAFTTRGRTMVNIDRIPGPLLNSLENNGDNVTYPVHISTDNFKMTYHAWTEYGLTYGRVIADDKTNFFKGGITIKYLAGVGAGYFGLNINSGLDKDANGPYLQNGTGQINFGTGGVDLNNIQMKFNGSGIGGDIGFVYEYRPAVVSRKDKNKYKFKVDVALHDIGSIRYSHSADDANYSLNFAGSNPPNPPTPTDTLQLNRFNNVSSFSDLDTALKNASPKIVKTSATGGKFNMSLPTSLTGSIDYHVLSCLYVNLGGMLSLNKGSSNLFKTHTADYIILTPRFEGKHFGISVPISNSSISGFNTGVSLRSGPFFIGSGSILSMMIRGNTEQPDFHFGFVFNSLQKRKKEKKVKQIEEVPVVVPQPVKILDSDSDGVADSIDKCPTVPGLAKYNGCPIPDTDSDGINDEMDKCPTVKGLARYNGCPIPDSDSDGVNDEEDKCPTVKGLARYHGCPIPDTDSDGVNDEEDKCPTVPGPASNNGCPIIKKALIQKVNFAANGLLFKNGKAVILKQSFARLNSVAQILKADSSLNLYIAGYTDNVGDSIKNIQLSTDRAGAAKAYFVKKGIAESRIATEGFGASDPIASNKTPKGRAKNRRVEFTLKNY